MARTPKREVSADQVREAERLKAIWVDRKAAHKLTQTDAGVALGITQGAVWQYLNGRIPIGTDALLAWARYLDFDPREVRPGFAVTLDTPTHTSTTGARMTTQFDTTEDALAAIAAGEMVVVVDDDDRENEGDLIMAASKATPEQVAFMIRHTSGILCAPMLESRAAELHLDPMVARNDAPMSTAFTVSVDYKQGLTTGISAEERAATVQALANSNAATDDFVCPGHIFPLVARQGGVLVRSGHTEAGVDLAALAGLEPVGLLAELVNDDGTVQRLPELLEFAREHELKIISIADLIAYRQIREQLVERTHEFNVTTRIGPARAFAYKTKFEDAEHLALVFGEVGGDRSVPVRIHREQLIADVFGSQSEFDQSLLDASLDRIAELGHGVVVYLRSGFVGVPLQRLEEQSKEDERKAQWLEIGVGAQILRDLELTRIRLIAGREVEFVGVSGFGLVLESTELLS